MKTKDDIIKNIKTIFSSQWTERNGEKIPEPENLALGNDALILDATVIYADLSDSTGLVDSHKPFFAAEVYKSYLFAACEVIRNNSGTITSFDGDRVMGIFIGKSKNSMAAKAGLQIHAAVGEINSLLASQYPDTTYRIRQAVGIDTSPIFAARTGTWKYNDIVWVGSSANYAAKLCALATPDSPTVITERVYNLLNETSKFGGTPKQDMWVKDIWTERGINIYRSNWHWDL